MGSIKEVSIEIRKRNIELLWFLSDRWFRVLEFSLILATLYYFENKTGSILINIIYWFSWIIFYMWFLELGELLSEKIASGKRPSKNQKFLLWIFSMFFVITIYTVITMTANSIISMER